MMPARGNVRDGLRDLEEFLETKQNIAGVGKGAELFGWWAFCVRETLRGHDETANGSPVQRHDCGALIVYRGRDVCPNCGRKMKWN